MKASTEFDALDWALKRIAKPVSPSLPQLLSAQVLTADAEIQAAIRDCNGNTRERNARIKKALVKLEAFYVQRIEEWMAGL